jgi:hypothetical protein
VCADDPSVLLEKGQFGKYKLMVGVTDDEGIVMTISIAPGLLIKKSKTCKEI